MRIRVDEIPDSGRILHIHWDEGRLSEFVPAEDPFELKLSRPVNVDLELNKRADHIRIEGNIQGVLQVTCHRCLKPFFWKLEEKFEVFLIEEQKAPQEEDLELDEEALDYEFFDGEVIEIDQLIAEQIFLALPFKVLCSESCRGLCPGCGANLNDEPCRCKKDEKDSPFARLAAIKTRFPASTDH